MKNQLTLIALAAIVITAAGLYFSSNTASQISTHQGFPIALEETKKSNALQSSRTVFQPFGKTAQPSVDKLTEFILDRPVLEQLYREQPQQINLKIPTPAGGLTDIPMEKKELLPADFKVTLNEDEEAVVDRGVHYQYIGSKDSIAAISVFEDAIQGLVSSQEGNFSISQNREKGLQDHYAVQLDDPLNGIDCGTVSPEGYGEKIQEVLAKAERNKGLQARAIDPVVKVYAEMENELFNSFNDDIQAAQQYIISLFNITSLIYANDGMKVQLSEARIWTDDDPYPSFYTRSQRLQEFSKIGNTYNGDMAALLGEGNLGGVANIVSPCGEATYSFSSVSLGLNPYPQWTHSTYLLAHELGHNIGSPHTHQCLWGASGNRPLDSCAPSEGNCAPAPFPPGTTGTIMSYCSNFSLTNGFGQQPAALLRAMIADADCLQEQSVYAACPLDSIFWNTTCVMDTTSNPTNNLFEVEMEIKSASATGSWSMIVNNQTYTYPYNQKVSLPRMRAWKQHHDVEIIDNNSGCNTHREITTPISCYRGNDCAPILYSQDYGPSQLEVGKGIVALPGGDAIVVGLISYFGNQDFDRASMQVRRIDNQGNLIWLSDINQFGNGLLEDVTQLTDGNYVAVGYAIKDSNPGFNPPAIPTIVKFDESGTLIWRRQYNGVVGGSDKLFAVKALPNGGFVAAGEVRTSNLLNQPIIGGSDGLVVEYDADGNITNMMNYGSTSDDTFTDISVLSSGGYALVGLTEATLSYTNARQNWVARIDAIGTLLWSEIKGETYSSTSLGSIVETADGNIAIGIQSADVSTGINSELSSNNGWIFKISSIDGSTLWRSNIQKGIIQGFYDLITLPNGDFYALTLNKYHDRTSVAPTEYGNVIRVDPMGEVLWEQRAGGTNNRVISKGVVRSDGTLLFTGWSEAFENGFPADNVWVFALQPDQCADQLPTCIVSPSVLTVTCDDSGTSTDRYDDTYSAEIIVQRSAQCGTSFNFGGNNYDYNDTVSIGPFPIVSGGQEITFLDSQDTTISTTLSLTPPPYCSVDDFDFIDLELTSDVANIDPDEYSFFSISFTITNSGNIAESNISTRIPATTDLVLQGGNQFSITAGDFNGFLPGLWRLDTLAPGASETLTLNYYNLSDDTRTIFVEVFNQNGTDIDSEHRNGTAPLVNEDDEVVVEINGIIIPECILSVTNTAPTCNNNNTPFDPSDDTFSAEITVSNNNDCSGQWTGGGQSGLYGNTMTFGPFLISDGIQTLVYEDSVDSTSTATITLTPPTTCSSAECILAAQVSNKTCDDNGTPFDPTDDLFSFDISITNSGICGSTWSDGTTTGSYGQATSYGPFPIATGLQTFFIADSDSMAATVTVDVLPAEPCSVPPSSIDLELSGFTSTADPDIYSLFSITYTLTNAGSTDETQVVVDIPVPSGLVLEGGNEYVASSGGYSSNKWSLNSIAAGTSETITVNYFNLSASAKTIFTEVLSQASTDFDSTPGNGNAPTPAEDDEAAVEINGVAQPLCAMQAVVSNIICDDEGTPNDLGDDTWSFDLLVSSNGNCGQDWTSVQGNGNYGAIQNFGPFNISDGDVSLTIQDLTDPSISVSITAAAPQPCSVPLICDISAVSSNITCDDLGTPNDPTDDTWSFDLLVNSNGNCGQDWTSAQSGGTYGVLQSFGPYVIANGDISLTISDAVDPSININIIAVAPAPCSVSNLCNITTQVSNITCDDNGTENESSDDLYFFDLTVNNTGNCSDGWSGGGMSGSYGQAKTFGPYLISRGDQSFSVSDTLSSNVTASVQVAAPQSCSTPAVTIDLELSATATTITPDEYSFVSTTFTIANNGTQAEQGITVRILTPNGLVLEGGNEYTLTQGSFRTGTNIWTVGGLAAGAQASITLNYFTLTEDEVAVYGQVLAQASTDLDSSPDNGTTPTPLEDDEAVVILNGSGPIVCAIQANVRNITCNDLNTPDDPSDDVWNFDVLVTSNGNCGTEWTSLDGDGTYGTIKSYGPFAITDGDINFVIQDVFDPTISTTILAIAPAPCSVPLVCEISATTTNITCDDAGTPDDTSDDLWSFDLLVNSNGNCGDRWLTPLVEGSYGIAQSFGPFNISDGDFNLVIQDSTDTTVSITTTITAPQPCSGAVQGVDLELNLIADNPNPGIWAQAPMHLTLSNTGTETATDIRVDFIDQSNPAVKALFAYTSSSAPAATSFNSWQGIWMIPSLAPGASVTLDYVGYSKTEDEILIYGEVIMQGQADVDSSPNNGNGTSAQEDDEAAFTLNASMALTLSLNEELRLYPNPARDYVRLELGGWANGPATLAVHNALGSLVYRQSWDALSDDVFDLDTSRFPSGTYVVTVRGTGAKMEVLRFGKVE